MRTSKDAIGASHRRKHHLSSGVGSKDVWVDNLPALTENEEPDALTGVTMATAAPQQQDCAASNIAASEEEEFTARMDQAIAFMASEVNDVGELVLEIGSGHDCGPERLTEEQLEKMLQAVQAAAGQQQAEATLLRKFSRAGAALRGEPAPGRHYQADVLVRRDASAKQPLEVRIAIIGNVDSGKSTLVGVLTRSMLDDGRGAARAKVFKHNHESGTGRTSSIGQHNLCLSAAGHILNDTMFKNHTCAEYVGRASKVVTMVDLAGHEKYFKTTAYGLTGHMPDYACIMVGANAGIVGMCKEHLGVALALQIPVFFAVTKVDICPEHILKNTLAGLSAILKRPGVRKRPFMVTSADHAIVCARNMTTEALAPIFLISSVTGQGLDLLRLFLNLLPQREKWAARAKEPAEFIIDETFGVPGVGTVVAGTVKKGVISSDSVLLLGPDVGDGSFKPTAIKSIHYKRMPVQTVVAGQTAALALKKVKRHQVRKGMVLVDEHLKPVASWEFEADIAILTHSTTIQPRYQAVIHCEIVRQAARVVAMDQERLRSGDRACVRFRFLQRPEYLTPGTRFVFREGRTKGIGCVSAVC